MWNNVSNNIITVWNSIWITSWTTKPEIQTKPTFKTLFPPKKRNKFQEKKKTFLISSAAKKCRKRNNKKPSNSNSPVVIVMKNLKAQHERSEWSNRYPFSRPRNWKLKFSIVISLISYIFPATKRSIYRRRYLQIRRFSNPSCPIQSTKRLQSCQSHFCSESSQNANHEDGEQREWGFDSQGLRWK